MGRVPAPVAVRVQVVGLVPAVPVAAVTTAVAVLEPAQALELVLVPVVASVAAPVAAAVLPAAVDPAAAVVVPVSVAVPRVPSGVRVVHPVVAASRSGRNAPNTKTCRPRSSVACGCRTATARSFAWPAARR
ncbi:hypothetical protein BOO86_14595 [Mycobacterium sp. CBMA 234]|nr:hypothetical protein [Mycolicibacterium sp. CBMA 234]